jgi:outer membrane protein TolC
LGFIPKAPGLRLPPLERPIPKIDIGLNKVRDTSDVHTLGFGVTIDLPFFDRNQGAIAIERATRQQLFDEYVARVTEARSEIVRLCLEIESTRKQVTADEETLPALEHLVDACRKALLTGNVSALDAAEKNLADPRPVLTSG